VAFPVSVPSLGARIQSEMTGLVCRLTRRMLSTLWRVKWNGSTALLTPNGTYMPVKVRVTCAALKCSPPPFATGYALRTTRASFRWAEVLQPLRFTHYQIRATPTCDPVLIWSGPSYRCDGMFRFSF